MIVVLNWQTFQQLYLLSNIIYVKENDDSWDLWTDQGLYHVKCTVEKEEDSEKNMMFVDRYFADKQNIVRVVDIITEEDGMEQKEMPMESGEAIGELVEEQVGDEEEDVENDEEGVSKGMTSEDDDHTHYYAVNEDGNGWTTETVGEGEPHAHEIVSWAVLEADDHIHTIGDIPDGDEQE